MASTKKGLDEVLAGAFKDFSSELKGFTGQLKDFMSPTAPLKAAGSAASAAGLPELGAAIQATAGALQQLFDVAQQCVQVISPAVIEQFNQAMLSVQATIGQAFIPLFVDLTDAFRQAANLIAPAFEELQPIIKQFADIFGNYLVRYVAIAADYFKQYVEFLPTLLHAFEPLLELSLLLVNAFTSYARIVLMVTDVMMKLTGVTFLFDLLNVALRAANEYFRIITEALNIFSVVFQSLGAVIEDFFGELLPVKDIFGQLHRAVNEVIKAMYVLAVQAAKTLGLNSVVDSILRNLDKKANAEGQQPAQQTSIKSFEQIAKDIAQRAAGASQGGGGGIEDERAFWKSVSDAAKAASADSLSLKEAIEKGFTDVIAAIPKPPGFETASKAGSWALERAEKNKYALAGAAVAGPFGALAGALFD